MEAINTMHLPTPATVEVTTQEEDPTNITLHLVQEDTITLLEITPKTQGIIPLILETIPSTQVFIIQEIILLTMVTFLLIYNMAMVLMNTSWK